MASDKEITLTGAAKAVCVQDHFMVKSTMEMLELLDAENDMVEVLIEQIRDRINLLDFLNVDTVAIESALENMEEEWQGR